MSTGMNVYLFIYLFAHRCGIRYVRLLPPQSRTLVKAAVALSNKFVQVCTHTYTLITWKWVHMYIETVDKNSYIYQTIQALKTFTAD